jgi:hypothetical protein
MKFEKDKSARRKKTWPALVVTAIFVAVKMVSKRYPVMDEISHYFIAGYLVSRIWVRRLF